jgi:ribosome-associated protein
LELHFDGPFLTLAQCLKLADVISSGGQAKWFLQEQDVFVNGEIERRRGRKLYSGDRVQYQEQVIVVKADSFHAN